ncbi:MAG: nuclear transport factor 2 family protein [Acidobacteria bacterium]|nr:nuclear transport factor 2 family protein [Acidobacteriota bacterium]
MSNKETISAIYEAFLRGDIPFILDRLTDDVEWNYATDAAAAKNGLPWLKLYGGRESVNDFFKAVDEMEIYQFDVLAVVGDGDEVASRIAIGCKYFVDEIVHFWKFNDAGKITRYQQFVDSAKQLAGYENAHRSAAA